MRRIILCFSCSVLLIIMQCSVYESATFATVRVPGRTWLNISYANISPAQKLDIYLPSAGDGPFPVVIWIHGGGFIGGSKDDPQTSLNHRARTALNNAGFAVVEINYRLSLEAKWPAQLDDIRSVVLFLKTNASKYFLNANKIGAWGASAGGYLASMMGIVLANDVKTRIQAVVDWFGPTDFFNMDADMALSGVSPKRGLAGDAKSAVSIFIGVQVSTHKVESDNANLILKVNALDNGTLIPAFLIMHGGKDSSIGANQSLRLHDAITTKFGPSSSTYNFLPEGSHAGGDFNIASTEETVINFFISKLKYPVLWE
jgi:acetyl esterase/lipase